MFISRKLTENSTDGTVRMVKMTNIDGEYMAVGRKTAETSTVLSPFTAGLTQKSTNVTGSGIQEIEYADGFRMSIKASQPMVVSANVVNGVSSSMTNGIMPVSKYIHDPQTPMACSDTSNRQLQILCSKQPGWCHNQFEPNDDCSSATM